MPDDADLSVEMTARALAADTAAQQAIHAAHDRVAAQQAIHAGAVAIYLATRTQDIDRDLLLRSAAASSLALWSLSAPLIRASAADTQAAGVFDLPRSTLDPV